MLNATYTMNVGTPPSDIVYGSKTQLDGTAVEYTAPSPQGDLVGRPSLTISHSRTKQGVVRSLVSFRTPRYVDGATGYKGFTKVDLVLNRTADQPTASLIVELEKLIDFLGTAGVPAELASATI